MGIMQDPIYRKGLFNKPSIDRFYDGRMLWVQWLRFYVTVHKFEKRLNFTKWIKTHA